MTLVALSHRIRTAVRTLSVNIDHIATLREARKESFPDPVQAAVMAELGGADGITVHLRKDRRHINERDVDLLCRTVTTGVCVEMAATEDMVRQAVKLAPSQVTIVPEVKTEVTTTSGLDVGRRARSLKPLLRRLKRAGIRLSAFVEPEPRHVEAAAGLGFDIVELNTDRYCREVSKRAAVLARMLETAGVARDNGIEVHVGHGLDYRNVVPVLEMDIADGFSIGFAIVARAVMVGLRDAVSEMKGILEVYS